jgi:hypothetical protein
VNNLYVESDIKKELTNVLKDLKNYFNSYKNSTFFLQKAQNLKFENECQQRIYDILIGHAIKAEAISAGGFESFIYNLYDFASSPLKEVESIAFSKSSLRSLISSFVLEHPTICLLEDCFKLAGTRGKIILTQHPINGEDDIIELNTGSYFNELMPAFDIKSTKFLNAKILCIDGFIESVSELHRILEDASKQKETVILFVRGLSDDVRHTLKINYDRGSLQVIPVIVKYDLDGVNLLKDIAILNSSDVISSLKGQLISNVDISCVNRIESIDISSSGILIENSSTSRDVDLHIKSLQQKILVASNQYEIEALTKRIQNLGTYRITIRLKNDQNKMLRSLEIDRTLRAAKSAITFGTCEYNNKIYPYASLKAGQFFVKKFFETIQDLGVILT